MKQVNIKTPLRMLALFLVLFLSVGALHRTQLSQILMVTLP